MSHILQSKTTMEGGIEYTCLALEEMGAQFEYTGSPIQMMGWRDSKTHKADVVVRKDNLARHGFTMVADLGFKVDDKGAVSTLADTFCVSDQKKYQSFLNEVAQRHNARRGTEILRNRGFALAESKMVDGHLKVRMQKVAIGR